MMLDKLLGAELIQPTQFRLDHDRYLADAFLQRHLSAGALRHRGLYST